MCTPARFAKKNDKAIILAWKPQKRAGDKNKKVNSIGSVTPVTNEVTAAGTTVPRATFLFSFGAAITIAAAAAGKPNIIPENLPSAKRPTLNPFSCKNVNKGTSCFVPLIV